MPIPQPFVLLPCHSLDDFPTHHRSTDADSLLACWTAAWHPRLIGLTGKQPTWRRADEPGEPEPGALLLIPTVAASWLPSGYRELAAGKQARLIEGFSDRDALVEEIFKTPDLLPSRDTNREQSQVGEFFALGYAFLQVQLMTRQLRGSSNLDEQSFETAVVAAATGWTEADDELTKQHLVRCFDLLLAEKNAYYPVQPELIDLVLMAETTIGKKFARELESDHPKSLLMTSDVGRHLQSKQPDNFSRLRQLVAGQRIDVVGGTNLELDDPLLSAESTVNQIRTAIDWYRKELGNDLSVYARRRFGLTSDLPAILDDFDFVGALHCAMSGGIIPVASTSNIRWEAGDGSSVLAFAQLPEDANEGSTFLRLAVSLGQAIDSAHVATLLLAHWPNRVHFCFEDLKQIGKFGPLFGKFTTLNNYFDAVYDPGYGDAFDPDEYRGEFLKTSVRAAQPDPISRIVNYWRRTYCLRSLRSALVQSIVINGGSNSAENVRNSNRLDDLQSRTDGATQVADDSLDQDIATLSNSLIRGFATGDSEELTLMNTTCISRTVHIETANTNVFVKNVEDTATVRFADSSHDRTDWILQVPPMSISSLASKQTVRHDVSNEPTLGQDNWLRNEFFEVTIDRKTGGIRSVDKYDRRNNLLSQQLAVRIPGQKDACDQLLTKARYSKMICDELQIDNKSRTLASITTRGRLIDNQDEQETTVSEFQQTVKVLRGKPLIELEISLAPQIELGADPNHYFCSRLAWKHDSAELYRSVQESRAFVMDDHFEAPNWIEIRGPTDTLSVLTGGMPFHRRSSRRMLDTLLLVAGETRRTFRFAFGLNLKYLHQSAVDYLTPPLLIPRALHSDIEDGWFFHFNCKNVMTTWWSPQFDDQDRCVGVELRCRETEDRSGELEIRCPFRLTSARRVNFLGDHLSSVDTEENIARISFHGGQYFQLQLNWNP